MNFPKPYRVVRPAICRAAMPSKAILTPPQLLEAYNVPDTAASLYDIGIAYAPLSEDGITCLHAIHPGTHRNYSLQQPEARRMTRAVTAVAEGALRYALRDSSLRVHAKTAGSTKMPMPRPFWHTDPGVVRGVGHVHMFAVVAATGGSTVVALPEADRLFELSSDRTNVPNGVQSFKLSQEAAAVSDNTIVDAWFHHIPEHHIIVGFSDIVERPEGRFLSDSALELHAKAAKHISPVTNVLESARAGYGVPKHPSRLAFICRLAVTRENDALSVGGL